jgi:hypothetical protein
MDVEKRRRILVRSVALLSRLLYMLELTHGKFNFSKDLKTVNSNVQNIEQSIHTVGIKI